MAQRHRRAGKRLGMGAFLACARSLDLGSGTQRAGGETPALGANHRAAGAPSIEHQQHESRRPAAARSTGSAAPCLTQSRPSFIATILPTLRLRSESTSFSGRTIRSPTTEAAFF